MRRKRQATRCEAEMWETRKGWNGGDRKRVVERESWRGRERREERCESGTLKEVGIEKGRRGRRRWGRNEEERERGKDGT